MRKTTYNMAVSGNRIWILKVERQDDETAKIRKVLLDTKLDNEPYRKYKVGELRRFPPNTYVTSYEVIKMTFDSLSWLLNL